MPGTVQGSEELAENNNKKFFLMEFRFWSQYDRQ